MKNERIGNRRVSWIIRDTFGAVAVDDFRDAAHVADVASLRPSISHGRQHVYKVSSAFPSESIKLYRHTGNELIKDVIFNRRSLQE